ncbi:MAG: branched-chain amino acid ABC transporter permease [Nitrososphaerota archaeon]|nr:branched-chain amino acid ABC transporter permease [Nitrososphaerota archaeon]
MTPQVLLQLNLVSTGLLLGLMYSLVAMSLAIIFKTTKVVNFSQGMLAALGAYLLLLYSGQLGLNPAIGAPLSLLSGVALALLVERVILRRFIGEPILSLIIVTLSLASLLRGIVMIGWGTNFFPVPRIFGSPALRVEGFSIPLEYAVGAAIAISYMVALAFFYKRFVMGAALRAVSEDHMAATAMGISVKTAQAFAWVLGIVSSMVGGMLLASHIGGVGLSLEYLGFIALPAVILGGLDSIPGAVVGGIFVGLAEVYSTYYLDEVFGGGFSKVFPLIVMLLIMLVRPYGLWGTERIERV